METEIAKLRDRAESLEERRSSCSDNSDPERNMYVRDDEELDLDSLFSGLLDR